tara:strand:+ start:541 stop:816 length:276 start_codon:yes stop_codon:yes gene_type:complete
MALSKQTITDKIETVKVLDHYNIQVRECTQILEDDKVISENFHRYILTPDHDVSTITEPLVLSQFNAVMTDEVKANYAKFVKEQAEQNKAS